MTPGLRDSPTETRVGWRKPRGSWGSNRRCADAVGRGRMPPESVQANNWTCPVYLPPFKTFAGMLWSVPGETRVVVRGASTGKPMDRKALHKNDLWTCSLSHDELDTLSCVPVPQYRRSDEPFRALPTSRVSWSLAARYHWFHGSLRPDRTSRPRQCVILPSDFPSRNPAMTQWKVVPVALIALILAFATTASDSFCQDTSLKPGINESFQNPDVEKRVEQFEGESREISQKRNEIVEACQLKPRQLNGTGLIFMRHDSLRTHPAAAGRDGAGSIRAPTVRPSSSSRSRFHRVDLGSHYGGSLPVPPRSAPD